MKELQELQELQGSGSCPQPLPEFKPEIAEAVGELRGTCAERTQARLQAPAEPPGQGGRGRDRLLLPAARAVLARRLERVQERRRVLLDVGRRLALRVAQLVVGELARLDRAGALELAVDGLEVVRRGRRRNQQHPRE